MTHQTGLRKALKALLSSVTNIGTVDTVRLDPDDLPRKIASVGASGQYWSVQVRGVRDEPATIGGGLRRALFRAVEFRLEGWRGIVGTTDAAEEFEAVIDGALDRLQTGHATVIGHVPGFLDWRDLGATVIDIVRVGASGRAHHAVITGTAEFYAEAR